MACCGSDNLLSGLMGACCDSCAQSSWSSAWGLGTLGQTGDEVPPIWAGDTFGAEIVIEPIVAGKYGSSSYAALISDALEGAGLSYNTSAVPETGVTKQWFMARGNFNVDGWSLDDLQNQFVAAINSALSATYTMTGQVTGFFWRGVVTHDVATGDTREPYYTPPGGDGSTGVPTPTPLPGDATLQQKQDNCSQQGLVYDAKSTKPGGCECGTIDGWLVSLGVKKNCTDTAFGFKSGVALAATVVAAVIFLPPLINKR
jgi:hypothetical protein